MWKNRTDNAEWLLSSLYKKKLEKEKYKKMTQKERLKYWLDRIRKESEVKHKRQLRKLAYQMRKKGVL